MAAAEMGVGRVAYYISKICNILRDIYDEQYIFYL